MTPPDPGAASAPRTGARSALNPFAVPRRTGEWISDGVVFGLAVLAWWFWGFAVEPSPSIPDWYHPIDVVLGAAACLSLWWLRRWPVAIGCWLIVPGSLAMTAAVAVVAAVYRVAVLARPRWSIVVTAGHILCALPYHAVAPVPGMSWVAWLITIPLIYLLMLSLGLLTRSRRQVIAGLTREAERERQGYEERLATLRRNERERIAAEMHDVLAHRLSLLSVHAGALEYRTAGGDDGDDPAHGLRPSEVHAAATVIRDNAHQAIEELRGMLLVLREQDQDATLATGPPQPRLSDLPALVDEAVDAGQRVELRVAAQVGPDSRAGAQRTVYRIVQECLTNARKHASRAPVLVTLEQIADTSVLRVTVTNPVPPGFTSSEIPGAGTGLAGLTERVRVEGGRLRYRVLDGEFVVTAEIPGAPATGSSRRPQPDAPSGPAADPPAAGSPAAGSPAAGSPAVGSPAVGSPAVGESAAGQAAGSAATVLPGSA